MLTELSQKQNSHSTFMPHLAYIDPDEEIISVIGRLRKASDVDVFLVVPKRALFMRSLVNLRLLDREAKKLGKHLSLVVQDAEARSLAEKAGIESRNSLEGIPGAHQPVKPSLPARLPQTQTGQMPSGQGDVPLSPGSGARLHSESIGSSSFFVAQGGNAGVAPQPASETPVEARPASALRLPASDSVPVSPMPRTVPVRDRTPKRLTALNSATSFASTASSGASPNISRGVVSPQDPGVVNRAPATPLSSKPVSDAASRVSFTFPAPSTPLSPMRPPVSAESPDVQASTPPSPIASPQSLESSTPDQSALSRFYQKGTSAPQSTQQSVTAKRASEKSVSSPVFRWILFGGVALSLLAVLGVSLVIFVPRADVTIIAKELSTSLDAEILARVDQTDVDVDKKYIPLRIIEVEKDIAQSFPSTGQASVSDKRARGMITLSNAFGESPQSLVATTRFESPDGKIFRLAKSVTIPGAKDVDGKSVPGTVDVEVVADASGEGYNIEPTTFTIPGLKGGPKYEKVTATSEKAFDGGGEGEGAIASVSADDVARAKDATLKALPELIRSEIEKDLQPGEKLLDDAFLSETLSSGAFPSVGAVTSSFDFRVHVSVRALVFSDADVRMVAAALLGDGANPQDIRVEYTVPHPDFTAKTLGVKVRVSVEKGQNMDIEQIKQRILGKSVGDVQAVFADYPNIQKIEVVFWPKFMTSRIPSRASQVSVKVETAAEGVSP